MTIVSHPSGNANVRQVLQALNDRAMLTEYVTFFATIKGGVFDLLARLPGCGEFERRRLSSSYGEKCAQLPWPELLRLLGQRFGLGFLIGHQTGLVCTDRNNQRLGKFAAGRLHRNASATKAVYCYEDAALETFQKAKKHGLATIYDLPTGYWRAKEVLFAEERALQPEWSQLLPALEDSAEKCIRKDKELELADLVLTASSFTNKTLKLYPGHVPLLKTIGYGADLDNGNEVEIGSSGKLRCLFVGSLNQQKGLSYMFKALEVAQVPVEMTVVGRAPRHDFAPLNKALSGVRYFPSLPHRDVLQLMRGSDVLLFPSLFDGFGLVMLEAMSQGCPVIATPNSGAPDVIDNGADGFIVPIRDSRAIAEALEVLHRNPERLVSMKKAAREKAKSRTWDAYRHGIVRAVSDLLATTQS